MSGVRLSSYLRNLHLLCLLCLAAASAGVAGVSEAAQECRSIRGSEVITREDIVNAGLERISEIFRLTERWSTASIDGYTWDAQASGLSPLSNPRWSVVVDGMLVDVGLFGAQPLNALPIHINDIKCVELVSQPHIAAGRLMQSGAIHIHTRKPDPGMTLGASVAAGNEVNDPGPFAYTSLATPNIDRVGPIGTGRIEIRAADRFARFSGKLDEFHVTDEQIDLRARQLYNIDSKPKVATQAVALTAGMSALGSSHHVIAGRSETEDLLFFETFGLEIPTMRRVDVIGATGGVRFHGGEFSYRGSYVFHELLRRPNAGDIALNFGHRLLSGGLQTRLGSDPISITTGGSVDLVDAVTDHTLSDSRTLVSRLFGLAEATLHERVHASAFGSWMQVDDRPAFAVMPSLHVLLSGERWIGVRASYERRPMSIDHSLWRWTQLGYALPERPVLHDQPAAGGVNDLTASPAPELITADLEFGGRMPEGVDYLFGAFYRKSSDDYYADHGISFSEETRSFLTHTTISNGVDGKYFGVHGRVGLNLFPGLTQHVTYVAEGVVSGDSLYEEAQAHVPSQRLALSTTYAPNDRFSLYARVRYHAGTAWNDYEPASLASSGFYPWQIPAKVLVDVAATKRFWHDHIIANISVRNLLNEPYRGHPAGAVFNMAFHFSLRVSFNSEERL